MVEMTEPEPESEPVAEDPALTEMKGHIKDAFSIFDHENNNTVDMREIGTIIRCVLLLR